jgi:hypothetical protein
LSLVNLRLRVAGAGGGGLQIPTNCTGLAWNKVLL